MNTKFAVLVNDVGEYSEVVEFDENNHADNPMFSKGWYWRWLETVDTYEEAIAIADSVDFSCTVYRLINSDPTDSYNYKIVNGVKFNNFVDNRGEWFPKAEFGFHSQAEEFVKSSVRWCEWYLKGERDAYTASQPSSSNSSENSDNFRFDQELLGEKTIDKLNKLGLNR